MSHQQELIIKISEQLKKMEDRLEKTIQTALTPAPLTEYVRKKVLNSAMLEFGKTVASWEKDMISVMEKARTAQDSLDEQLEALQLEKATFAVEKRKQIEELTHIAFKTAELDAQEIHITSKAAELDALERDLKKRKDMLMVSTRSLQERIHLMEKYEAEVDRRTSEVKAANKINVDVNNLMNKIEAMTLHSRYSAMSPPIPHGISMQAPFTTPQTVATSSTSASGAGITMEEPFTTTSSIISKRMSLPVTPARNRDPKRQRFAEPHVAEDNTMEAFNGEALADQTASNVEESIDTRITRVNAQGSPRQRNSRQQSIPKSPEAGQQAGQQADEQAGQQANAEEKSTDSPEPQLSTAMQSVFDQLVLPSGWTSFDINSLKQRLIDTEAAEKRDQPVLVFNSLANQPCSRNWEFHGASCWTSKLKRFESRKLSVLRCDSCSTAKVKCVYAEYVDGVVTNKGTWKNGAVANRDKKPHVETVEGKRWKVISRN